MNLAQLQRHRQPWVLGLLLAWLLFTGWGQVHRVLHLGLPSVSVAKTVTASTSTSASANVGLADEDGSGLCQLLDHLSHGTAWLTDMAIVWPGALPVAAPALRAVPAPARSALAFEARGPPPLT